MVKSRKYLIDSSSLLAPYRQYYAFDLVPSFWDRLKPMFVAEKIVLLDKIWDELTKGAEDDQLMVWLRNNKLIIKQISFKTEPIIKNYASVLNYIQSSELYLESAIKDWASAEIADPWLIASAKAHGLVLVTEEQGSRGISKAQKNKSAKIPDVAKALDVEVISLFEMMRQLNIKI